MAPQKKQELAAKRCSVSSGDTGGITATGVRTQRTCVAKVENQNKSKDKPGRVGP